MAEDVAIAYQKSPVAVTATGVLFGVEASAVPAEPPVKTLPRSESIVKNLNSRKPMVDEICPFTGDGASGADGIGGKIFTAS